MRIFEETDTRLVIESPASDGRLFWLFSLAFCLFFPIALISDPPSSSLITVLLGAGSTAGLLWSVWLLFDGGDVTLTFDPTADLIEMRTSYRRKDRVRTQRFANLSRVYEGGFDGEYYLVIEFERIRGKRHAPSLPSIKAPPEFIKRVASWVVSAQRNQAITT